MVVLNISVIDLQDILIRRCSSPSYMIYFLPSRFFLLLIQKLCFLPAHSLITADDSFFFCCREYPQTIYNIRQEIIN